MNTIKQPILIFLDILDKMQSLSMIYLLLCLSSLMFSPLLAQTSSTSTSSCGSSTSTSSDLLSSGSYTVSNSNSGTRVHTYSVSLPSALGASNGFQITACTQFINLASSSLALSSVSNGFSYQIEGAVTNTNALIYVLIN